MDAAESAARDYRKGVLIVAFGALMYAPDSLMLRLMDMDQWPTLFWRGLIGGGGITAAMFMLRGRRFPRQVRALGWSGAAFVAVFTATSICFVFAVRETSVANTLFLVSTSPVFSALISWAALGERPGLRTVRTILLALGGVALIAFGGQGVGANTLKGDLAALGAAFFLATSFVIARSVRPLDMIPLVGPAGLVSAALAGLLAADLSLPDHAIAPMLAMGVVIMPVGTLCLATGPRYLPAPEVSLLMLIEAVAGPLIVWWALGEYPGAATLTGGAVILAAIAWSSLERARGPRFRR